MRNLPSGLASAILNPVVEPVFFVYLDFPSTPIALWTGIGLITVGGVQYQGVGGLLEIGELSEPSTPTISSLSIGINGVVTAYLAKALGEHFQLRDAKVGVSALDTNGALVDSSPYWYFSGFMNSGSITTSADTGSITIVLDGPLADLRRTKERRYNNADQQIDFPSDRGFEYATALSPDRPVYWGRTVVRINKPEPQDENHGDYDFYY